MRTLALVLLGLFLAVDVEAACTGSSPTWTSTPDQVSVASCVSSATRGDTINVSAGSATWSSLSTITKGVTLQGVGTPTITAANGSNFILQYTPATPSNDDLFRVTGFVFNMNSAGSILHLSLSTTVEQHNIRVDNNTFQNGVFGVKPLLVEGPFYGVVDHNTFTGSAYIENYGSSAGSNNWTNLTFDPGSAKSLYYEDNTFSASDTMFAGGNGGRYVFRYNTVNVSGSVISPLLDAHGNMGPGGNYGTMGVEVYGNLAIGSTVDFDWIDHRGGKGWVFNNRATGSGTETFVHVREEHADTENPPANTSIDGTPQHVNHSYYWQNRDRSDNLATLTFDENTGSTPITQNVDFFNHITPFTGAVGVGVGTLAQMNAITPSRTGVGFWATTDSATTVPTTLNTLKALSGTLYRWTGSAWSSYYTPYAYPHPLTKTTPTTADNSPPSAPVNLRVM